MPQPSTVKVRDAIDQLVAQLPELQRRASGMQAIALAAVAPFLPNLVAGLVEQLPDDPAQLDAILGAAGEYVRSLQSDEPEPPAIAAAPEDLDAATADLDLAEAA